jgi:single-strand DNA-binding protein
MYQQSPSSDEEKEQDMVNNCTFVGYLGRDPELKTAANEKATVFCHFSLAVDKPFKKKDAPEEKPLWFNVTCFGATATFAGTYLKKGSLVYVNGELGVENYAPKDGGPERQSLRLIANTVQALEKRSDTAGASTSTSNASAVAAAKATDDDIPF